MSVLTVFKSRAVKLGLVLTIVRHCEAINEVCTAYRVARALDCSHVTARKYLKMLVECGDCVAVYEQLSHTERVSYKLLSPALREEDYSAYSHYLIKYHTDKANA